ncbi:MAG: multifunctional nuclease/2,3-cyclic-nucleotide, partial [Ilumatobacteraceae bacterium]|nr:multifunctional nuclease/2,3-cyclic-nucleotide [Ilumatobacteraceae bacterium]
ATLQQELAQGGEFAKIVNQTSAKVDAIFTGHTHRQYAYDAPIPGDPSHTRPVLQTGSYGDFIGHVVLSVDPTTFDVTTVLNTDETRATTPPTTDATYTSTYPNVANVKTIVDNAIAYANSVGNQPTGGSLTASITRAFNNGTVTGGVYTGGTTEDRGKESTLGNLVANALVATLSPADKGGATIGVVNPGGLRADLSNTPDPAITVAEATSVLPFANTLNTISLTGAQFKTLLEQQWQRLPDGTVPTRPYLQLGLSDNVSYTFDSSLAEGSRITSITIGGNAIDPTASYRIGTFSFLTDGGDNFRIFTQGTNKKDSGLIDADGWISYLSTKPALGPNFARHSAEVKPTPTAVAIGGRLQFTASSLDLTSNGSPANTTVSVTVGGVSAGTATVTNGTAVIDLAVPAGVPKGAQPIVLTAQPTNTKITIPVTVTPTLTPVTPTRLFDTRAGESPNSILTVPKAKLDASGPLEVKVIDLPGGLVPKTGVGAVSLNVTVTNAAASGFLTVYPCGTRKEVSSVNYTAGQDSANAVTVPVSATGTVCFFSQQPSDVVVDVNGWLAVGSGYTAVGPDRVFDTRAGESPAAVVPVAKTKVGGTNVLEVKVIDLPGLVPASGATAVSLNVTAVNATQDGFVTVYPCGARKEVSSLNVTNGRIVANAVVTPISATGTVCFYSQFDVDLVVDVNGYYTARSSFTSVSPDRVFDTRAGQSPGALRTVAKTQVGGATVLEVQVTNLPGVVPSSGVGSVSLNVAAVNATVKGFLTVYPCGDRTLVSSLNYVPGQIATNAVVTPVSATGTVCFYSQNPVDILADVNGWFAS